MASFVGNGTAFEPGSDDESPVRISAHRLTRLSSSGHCVQNDHKADDDLSSSPADEGDGGSRGGGENRDIDRSRQKEQAKLLFSRRKLRMLRYLV